MSAAAARERGQTRSLAVAARQITCPISEEELQLDLRTKVHDAAVVHDTAMRNELIDVLERAATLESLNGCRLTPPGIPSD